MARPLYGLLVKLAMLKSMVQLEPGLSVLLFLLKVFSIFPAAARSIIVAVALLQNIFEGYDGRMRRAAMSADRLEVISIVCSVYVRVL